MSQGVYVLRGKCPGGKCPGGICPWVSVRGVHVLGGYVLEPFQTYHSFSKSAVNHSCLPLNTQTLIHIHRQTLKDMHTH